MLLVTATPVCAFNLHDNNVLPGVGSAAAALSAFATLLGLRRGVSLSVLASFLVGMLSAVVWTVPHLMARLYDPALVLHTILPISATFLVGRRAAVVVGGLSACNVALIWARTAGVEFDALASSSHVHHLGLVGATGVLAMSALAAAHYDVVLMDCSMPVMDGFEATRQIRRNNGPQPWIIALTAHSRSEDRQACLDAGMDDFLTKPLRKDDLRSALQRWRESMAARLA